MGGVNEAEKVGKIVKIAISGADVVIGVSHAAEDFGCNDVVCGTLDIIENLSSPIGLIVGNTPVTKHFTFVTGSVTLGCCSVRYSCKNYNTFWGCIISPFEGVKTAVKFSIKK